MDRRVAGEVPLEPELVAPLVRQVRLLGDRLHQLADDLLRIDRPIFEERDLQNGRHLRQNLTLRLDDLDDPGPPDFHGDDVPFPRDGPMDLRDAAGGQRRRVEALKDHVQRAVQFPLDFGHDALAAPAA